MAELNWKASGQDKALEFIDKNILVSASAGSGKTTVMVEKIFRYLKTGSITRLIVITFTRASAADMKEKLTKKLSNAIREGGEYAEHYKKQLRALPMAYIGTIDSLCQEIYKRWFEDIGGSPDFSVLEETEADALRAEAIRSIAEELIAKEDADFKDLEEKYSQKRGLEPLYKATEKVMRFADTQEDAVGFLDMAERASETPIEDSPALNWLASYYRKRLATYHRYAEAFCAKAVEQGLSKLKAVADTAEDYIFTLAHAEDMALFYRVAEPFGAKKPTKTKNDTPEVAELYDSFGDFLKDFKGFLKEIREVAGDFDVTVRRDAESKRTAKKLITFVKMCSARYSELKRDDAKADFADLERNALAIVKNDARAKELAESIDYIFLDEYQDTNRLQEAIISRIERGNLFMVGDVKQAIYGFRSAEADIFLERYRSYKDGEAGKNVPLNTNFRSEQRILSFIDAVFSSVMTYDFGGIDYLHDSLFGKAGIPFKVTDNSPATEIALFTGDSQEKIECPPVYSVKEGATKVKQENPECRYIASKIAEIVGKRTLFDRKSETARPIAYSDIAILVRQRTGADELLRALEEYGIPYDGSDMNVAGETRDINAIDSLLRVMDNSEQDFPLVASMLSYFGGFDESELVEIRSEAPAEDFFYKAVRAYDGRLKPKIDAFYALIEKYASLAPLCDVATLIRRIGGETGFISYLFSGGEYDRIEIFNSYVKFLEDKTYAKNVADYLAYKSDNPDLSAPRVSGGQDKVSVLTMHKSKGLEFPVVFMAGCSRKMRGVSSFDNVSTDSQMGIAVAYFDQEDNTSGKSLTRVALDKRADVKCRLEEARIMYVAMTRAKYYLYITGFEKKSELKQISNPANAESYMDWLRMSADNSQEVKDAFKYNPWIVPSPLKQEERKEMSEIPECQIEYLDYAYKESTALGTKYSVTALNASEEREQNEYIESLGAQDTQKGIAYHKVMELIDFNLCSFDEVKAFVESLERDGTIPKNEVVPQIIVKALKHPIFEYARKGKCLREQEFIYYAPACEVLENAKTTDRTLVQGVMDLIIEGDRTVLVDYKVSGSPAPVLRERYRTQIELYAKAYEAITGKAPDVKAVFVLNRAEYIEF